MKIRELHSHHCDSTIWNDFNFRDDIIIATYVKFGTTWTLYAGSESSASTPSPTRAAYRLSPPATSAPTNETGIITNRYAYDQWGKRCESFQNRSRRRLRFDCSRVSGEGLEQYLSIANE